jgi:hypothetical protein
MEPVMKVIGRMIYNTVTEKKCGPIIQNMKVNIWKVKSMERGHIYGQMVALTLVIGSIIRSKALENTFG